MIIAGIVIIAFSIMLIKANSRREREFDRRLVGNPWQRCSARAVSLAYQAQLCFVKSAWDVAHVCFSPETGTFWIEYYPNDERVWSMELRRDDSFDENCVKIDRFIAVASERAKELEEEY